MNETISLTDVNNTSLLTLYCRSTDSRRQDRIIHDPVAEMLTARLDPILATSDDVLLKTLSAGKVDSQVVVHISLRGVKYDEYAKAFLAQHPNAVIVNIGCGMDTRFYRVDNGRMDLIDLDFSDVISLKSRLLESNPRYHLIGSSVLDYTWMDQLKSFGDRPILFLAEGLFMYLKPEEVKDLVLTLLLRFPGSELAAEVFNSYWLQEPWGPLMHRKMQQRLKMGKDAHFNSGLVHARELEGWDPQLKFIDDWSYFDTGHPRLGAFRILKYIRILRNIQYTVHYKLGDRAA